MAGWKSTTKQPNVRCGLWFWAARTSFLRDRIRAGRRAAAMYTLIGSAKLNSIDPEAYLAYVLARIADHSINHIAELLPWNVNLSRTTEASETC
jgi:hypothetical protein